MLKQDVETQGNTHPVLTARVSESDKVLGLELGAFDYLTKPLEFAS
jgi:DNA-binding response OmpR family regulator